ncbi:MAG: S1 family peptidase [Defluviitaleaceae bacterium]|nr:S1 family peptidase [Defluviitaleaceae bacterium]
MKKMLKKVVALALMLTLLVASAPQMIAHGAYIPQGDGFDAFHNALVAEYGLDFAINYRQALEIANNIHDNFPRNRMGDVMYPENFGGMYIDEFGNLNVLIVISNMASISAFNDNLALPNEREVAYSYNDLWGTMNSLNELIGERAGACYIVANVDYWYLDVIGNRVVIALFDFNQSAIDIFKRNILDSTIIAFAESTGEIVETSQYINPVSDNTYTYPVYYEGYVEIAQSNIVHVFSGEYIRVIRNGAHIGGGSIGYRANLGSLNGFITAAHLASAHGNLRMGDNIFNGAGQLIGRVSNTSHLRLNDVDAAFITTQPNVMFNSWCNLHGQNIMEWRTPSIIAGTRAIMDGYRTGPRIGSITAVGISVNFSGFTVTNAVRTNITSHAGDSGGIAYMFNHSSDSGVLGIAIGGSNAGYTWNGIRIVTNTVFSRADNINRTLGARMP